MVSLKGVFRASAGPRLVIQLREDTESAPGANSSPEKATDVEMTCTFYDAVSSKKHQSKLGIQELVAVFGLPAGSDIPTTLSQDSCAALYTHYLPDLQASGLARLQKEDDWSESGTATAQSHLDDALRALAVGDLHEACRRGKQAVAHAREAARHTTFTAEGAGGRATLGAAYELLGGTFTKLDKPVKAAMCYALALQADPALENVRRAASWALVQLANTGTGGAGGVGGEAADSDAFGVRSVGDIEDLQRAHTVLGAAQPTGFSCSQCGECCRTRDNILLSPLDIFLLSRAPALGRHLVTPTMRMYRHPSFREAFVFSTSAEDGYPTCQLRPVHSSLGRCHFSYPLLDSSNGTLSADDAEEYMSFYEERNASWKDGDGEEGEEDADLWQEREADLEGQFPGVEPRLNASGRPTLGCILGEANMPTLCASYPLVPEQDIVGTLPRSPGEVEAHAQALGNGVTLPQRRVRGGLDTAPNASEDSFVMVKSLGCAGFDIDTKAAEDTETVEQYLQRLDLRQRWDDLRWFNELRQAVAQYLPCVGNNNKYMPSSVRRTYMSSLRRIWFDFDCTAPVRRPVRTYARLKAEVEEATWALARATKTFMAHKWNEPQAALAVEYDNFVERLEIIVHIAKSIEA